MSLRRLMSVLALFAVLAMARQASATPSTQIWIPSTDAQKFETLHLNYDTYMWPEKPVLMLLGPTIGVLPFDKIQMEVGFDLIFQGNPQYDDRPFYLHGKVATPEDAFFKWQPAVAVGVFNVGTFSDGDKGTNQNLGYGLLARTLPVIGRISVGYYYGNPSLLVDQNGQRANQGLLASWDRTMSELSDKLWLAVDYMGGKSSVGSFNAGVAWSFAPNVSVIVGYDRWLDQNVTLTGKQSITVQLDINVEPFSTGAPAPGPVPAPEPATTPAS